MNVIIFKPKLSDSVIRKSFAEYVRQRVCFFFLMVIYVHRNRKDGEPRTATSTFTQLLSSDNMFNFALRPQRLWWDY